MMAVKEFLEKLKSRELFNALNEVYSEPESLEETTLKEKSKRYYSKKILKMESKKTAIPVLARQSASARRRETCPRRYQSGNGNPEGFIFKNSIKNSSIYPKITEQDICEIEREDGCREEII